MRNFSIQLEKPSPWGFYATLSLGLLQDDFNLSELVLSELNVLKDRKECIEHFAILKSYFYLLKVCWSLLRLNFC